jgi:hypothetical protein
MELPKLMLTSGGVTFEIDGGTIEAKDMIVYVKGNERVAKSWYWSVYNFHHDPGYTAAFLNEVPDYFETIILSSGQHGMVKCSPDVAADPRVRYVNTTEVPAVFRSELRAGRSVVAFVHSTC